MSSSARPTGKWGNATVEDVMAQARKLVERVVREDACFGTVTIFITPTRVDVKESTNIRFGEPQEQ